MAKDDTMVRVRCTIKEASNVIGGVRFGRAPKRSDDDAPSTVSEPITEAQAASYLSIEGFALCDDLDRKALAAVDEAIAAGERDATAQASGVGAASQALTEQQRANQALTGELASARKRIVELEAQSGDAAVQALREQVTELTTRVTEREQALGAAQTKIAEQEAEITRLREANKTLGEKSKDK